MSCNSSDISIQNAFYLDSTLNQQHQQYGSSDHQLSNGPNDHGLGQQHQQHNNLAFSNDSSNLYFTSSQMAQMQGTQNSNNHNNMNNGGMSMNSLYNTNSNQQQLTSNSSHCTTPQTPSSIPDIILTGKSFMF